MKKYHALFLGFCFLLPTLGHAQLQDGRVYSINEFLQKQSVSKAEQAPQHIQAAPQHKATMPEASADPVPPRSSPIAATPLTPVATLTAPTPPDPDTQIKEWAILLSDRTLFRTMRRWSEEANYQLFWQIDRDFPIEIQVSFQTSYLDAVHQVMKGVAVTDFPLQATFNKSTRVVRVTRHMSN